MSQSAFHSALLAPDAPVPPGLVDPKGRPAGKRFDVYRNNVVVSLSEALAEAFPVIKGIVGEAFFSALAGQYVRQHPPRDPRIATWGGSFAGFLASFPPVAHLPYLPDVARLEQARRESYHAADSTPANPATITPQSRFALAPSVRLVQSPYPIHAIWRFTRGEGPKPEPQAQSVLVTRPGYDPQLTLLAPEAPAFLAGLAAGETLEEATPDGFDITETLTALLSGGALTEPQP
ncbi:DNA-binding domain-containing protein [Vannielia litorea]|uniref:Putative DNA-binding domain-containing protein n=1 Tax=Vannielia litorea TaxID=1217970 RepID=A0A1N6EE23_9RHOB|nr:DNA-binding domain-containing protein [Vannielia litorea]SIN81288.1 Putative DNA-binding domain-containing protein [Vannielia litorea]